MTSDSQSERLRLGDLLVRAGRLSEADLKQGLAVQRASGETKRLGATLVELGLCSEDDVANALAEQFQIPRVPDGLLHPDPSALEALGLGFCRQSEVIPLQAHDGMYLLAMADPLSIELVDVVRRVLRCRVRPAAASRSAILKQLGLYAGGADPLESMVHEASLALACTEGEESELAAEAVAGPTVRLVSEVLNRALDERASDIHIEPGPDAVAIRFRVDGALRNVLRVPSHLLDSTVARIKIMSELDITERRVPQDGHLRFQDRRRATDFRVSTMPTIRGEKCVLRILGSAGEVGCLDDIGFTTGQLEAIRRALRQPQGCVIVTGPTGSGKSTTLYACVNEIPGENLNIATIEDPVERDMPGITQTQVHEATGMTFATGLRALLRQDPDVMMVGEVRDLETAEIAMRASLTGHLMLTTLHANDAIAGFTRFRDLGIDDYLLSSGLSLIVAQRLMRRLCPSCRVAARPDRVEMVILEGLGVAVADQTFYEPRGCDECGQRGYAGRLAAAEVVVCQDELPLLVSQGAAEPELREAARQAGTQWMFEAGLEAVLRGDTSLKELVRVVPLPRRAGRASPAQAVAADVAMVEMPDSTPMGPIPRQMVFAMERRTDPRAFEAFCRGLTDLPTVPAALARLNAAVADPNADVAQVAEVIETDQVLAARVLRVANSAMYAVRREISTVGDAVLRLGLDQVWTLAVATSIIPAFRVSEEAPFSCESLWTHTLASAVFAREVAPRVPGVNRGQASVAALLHDIGLLVLALHRLPDLNRCLRIAQAAGVPLWQIEQQELLFTHADVGGWLLEEWHVPRPICAAVTYHHRPGEADGVDSEESGSLSAIVSLANDVVKLHGIGDPGDNTVLTQPSAQAEALGLSAEDVEAAARATLLAVPGILEALETAQGNSRAS